MGSRRYYRKKKDKIGPYPEFSMSLSAIKSMDPESRYGCLRKRYLSVYQSHHGWDKKLSLEDPRRLAYTLKKAKSVRSLIGDIVHEVAKEAIDGLQAGLDTSLKTLAQRAVALVAKSKRAQALELWRKDPKRAPMLIEEFYGGVEYDREEVYADIQAEAVRKVRLLWETPHFVHLRDLAEADLPLGVLYCEEKRRLTRDVVGVGKVVMWAALDLAYAVDGAVTIVDWKTGSPSDYDERQGWVYGHIVQSQAEVPIDLIACNVVYLDHPDESLVFPISDEVGAAAREAIDEGSRQAAQYVVGGNITTNQPLPIESFPMVDEDSGKCTYCEFRRMCGRESSDE